MYSINSVNSNFNQIKFTSKHKPREEKSVQNNEKSDRFLSRLSLTAASVLFGLNISGVPVSDNQSANNNYSENTTETVCFVPKTNYTIHGKKTNELSYLDYIDEHNNPLSDKTISKTLKHKIPMSALTDKNGRLNDDMLVFDLNGDSILDAREKSYFANGGIISPSSNDSISLKEFTNALRMMDLLNIDDGKISTTDKKHLYKFIEGAEYMFQTIPKPLRSEYALALKNIAYLHDGTSSTSNTLGSMNEYDSAIEINLDELKNKQQIASNMLHELTHAICMGYLDHKADPDYNIVRKESLKDTDDNSLAQEVQTHWAEYAFLWKNMSEDDRKLLSPDFNKIWEQYDKINDNYKDKYDTKSIAVTAFAQTGRMSQYETIYQKPDSFIYNAKFTDNLGGIFKSDKTEAPVFEDTEDLKLYDKNGNNIINDKIKNILNKKNSIKFIDYNKIYDLDFSGNNSISTRKYKTQPMPHSEERYECQNLSPKIFSETKINEDYKLFDINSNGYIDGVEKAYWGGDLSVDKIKKYISNFPDNKDNREIRNRIYNETLKTLDEQAKSDFND